MSNAKKRQQKTRQPSFKKLWAELSLKMRQRTPYCEVCRSKEHLQVHHLLPKKLFKEYKLDEENLIVLCPKHHNWGRQSAHKGIWWFVNWLMRHKPKQFKWLMEHI